MQTKKDFLEGATFEFQGKRYMLKLCKGDYGDKADPQTAALGESLGSLFNMNMLALKTLSEDLEEAGIPTNRLKTLAKTVGLHVRTAEGEPEQFW